jgi:hypothetical protein
MVFWKKVAKNALFCDETRVEDNGILAVHLRLVPHIVLGRHHEAPKASHSGANATEWLSPVPPVLGTAQRKVNMSKQAVKGNRVGRFCHQTET